MGQRIDYYDDPDAPAANILVPSVQVVVTNPAGEVLRIGHYLEGRAAPYLG